MSIVNSCAGSNTIPWNGYQIFVVCDFNYIFGTGCGFKQSCNEHMKILHSTTGSTFENYHIETVHTGTNIFKNTKVLHINIQGLKAKHTWTTGNIENIKRYRKGILNEKTHLKLHILFEHIMYNKDLVTSWNTGATSSSGTESSTPNEANIKLRRRESLILKLSKN